jgi:hypothetical protein
LPTELTSSPSLFIDSMVGSSWKAAESSGVAPMRSPAATVSVLSWPRTCPLEVRREVLHAPDVLGGVDRLAVLVERVAR